MLCEICKDPIEAGMDTKDLFGIQVCRYCKNNVPVSIIQVMTNKAIETVIHGITFTKSTWRLYPVVVKRFKSLGRPLQFTEEETESTYTVDYTDIIADQIHLQNAEDKFFFFCTLSEILYDFTNNTCQWVEQDVPDVDQDKYPHVCPFCGKPAYIGGQNNLDCSVNCQDS